MLDSISILTGSELSLAHVGADALCSELGPDLAIPLPTLPVHDAEAAAEADKRRVALLERQRGEWQELRALALGAARTGDRASARAAWLAAEALRLIHAGERATIG